MEFPNRGAVYRTKCCGELIQSLWRHDFVSCSCGGTYVDGGGAYTRIVWKGEPPEVVK